MPPRDLTNTGLESGLDKTFSDYVGRVMYQPNQVFSFIARGRFSGGLIRNRPDVAHSRRNAWNSKPAPTSIAGRCS